MYTDEVGLPETRAVYTDRRHRHCTRIGDTDRVHGPEQRTVYTDEVGLPETQTVYTDRRHGPCTRTKQ